MSQTHTPLDQPWRSLEQRADTPEFRDFLEGEFPQVSTQFDDKPGGGLNRRRFLQLMAASIGLAGLAGCRRPVMEILPFSKQVENVIPGLPAYYATTLPRPGGGFPVLVESHEGRPTKIEGNPNHPFSRGASDTFAQASILDLYDPERARQVLRDGAVASWRAWDDWSAGRLEELAKLGKRVRFLSEQIESPALRLVRAQLPEAVWHTYEPIASGNAERAAQQLFGKRVRPVYHFDRADRVVALDADFLGQAPDAVPHIRAFSKRRAGHTTADSLSRLYVIENSLSITGARADNRLSLPTAQVFDYLVRLATVLLTRLDQYPAYRNLLTRYPVDASIPAPWIDAVANDLLAHRGKSLLVAGERQPVLVHLLVHLLNQALGSQGTTLDWLDVPEPGTSSLAQLVEEMKTPAAIDTLFILGGNPVYNAPADYEFASRLRNVSHRIRVGMYVDETSRACNWHLPLSHALEAWGDLEMSDGTYSAVQPLIAPLWETRSPLEVVAGLTRKYRTTSAYAIVQESFRVRTGKDDPVAFRRFLHEGFHAGSAWKKLSPGVVAPAEADFPVAERAAPPTANSLEVAFHADPSVYDGRYANNGWLHETPDPLTKLVWDNAALISPKLAKELTLTSGDLVQLKSGERTVTAAVFLAPGQADYSVSVALGYGRSEVGVVGKGTGFDVYPLRTSTTLGFVSGVTLTATGKRYQLVTTQDHGTMNGHDLAPSKTPQEYETWLKAKEVKEKKQSQELPLVQHPAFTGQQQWGMSIDLDLCVGCNACMVACQAENNVPIVGKEEVERGRELSWIRLDRYYLGEPENPTAVVHQPVACVHCEAAPCETVCPVNASVHSPEGLNLQVYNRCVGTRYCANNCTYKVRRFNWFDYNEKPLQELRLGPLTPTGMAETLKMQKNPDVTVRTRGIMEKCTYCIQRIERGKIGAKLHRDSQGNYEIPDGGVTTACAQACPASAIVFGNLKDPQSRVSKAKQEERQHILLESVGTKPRTTYAIRLRNPNPALTAPSSGGQP